MRQLLATLAAAACAAQGEICDAAPHTAPCSDVCGWRFTFQTLAVGQPQVNQVSITLVYDGVFNTSEPTPFLTIGSYVNFGPYKTCIISSAGNVSHYFIGVGDPCFQIVNHFKFDIYTTSVQSSVSSVMLQVNMTWPLNTQACPSPPSDVGKWVGVGFGILGVLLLVLCVKCWRDGECRPTRNMYVYIGG